MTVTELIAELQKLQLPDAIVDVAVQPCEKFTDIMVTGIEGVLKISSGPNQGAWVTLELDWGF